MFVITGRDFIGGGNKTNAATIFILLKHWDERKDSRRRRSPATSRGRAQTLRDGMALAFNPPAIRGLGTAGGFELYVQARADPNPQQLVPGRRRRSPRRCASIRSSRASTRSSARRCRSCASRWTASRRMALGVPVPDVFDALQSTMGALYVNDFNMFGRTYRVQMQADAPYRAQPEDLGAVYVRSTTTRRDDSAEGADQSPATWSGPEQVERFNGFLAAQGARQRQARA